MEEIADAIAWLIHHPEEAEEMGRRGKQAVLEKYSWKHEAQKLQVFYDQIISMIMPDNSKNHFLRNILENSNI